jgi:hypothetical protein
MNVLAVSDFIRTLGIIFIATPFIMLWGAAVLDVIRRHYSGWSIVGWLLLILLVPVIGPLIYFATRDPSREDVEQTYLAQRDIQRQAAGRPVGGTRIG